MDTGILIGIGGVLLVLFPALGWKSLRYLREAPDFPHRGEMIWGAKYGGALLVLSGVIPMWAGAAMAGHQLPWAMTVFGAGKVVFWALMLAASITFWPGVGAGVALSVMRARRRHEPFSWHQHVLSMEKRRRAWWHRLFTGFCAAIMVFWGYFTVHNFIPTDRMGIALDWSKRVEARMSEEMADLSVEEVGVYRELFSRSPRPLPIPEGMHDNSVSVELAAGADRNTWRQALERVERVLAAEDAPGEWQIRVRAEGAEPLTTMWRGGGAG